MNIYAKLTLLCLFLVVVSSSILFYATNSRVTKAYEDELLTNISKQSEATISNIERFIFSRLNDLKMASRNPYFRITDISNDELTRRLQELENINDLYYSFSFFNMDRVRLADSKRLSIGKQHTPSLYWVDIAKGEESVMDISMSESVGRVVMHFASTVTDYYNEKPTGVLVGRILADELYQILGDISLGQDTTRQLEVTLMSKDGLILYSNNPSLVALRSNMPDFNVITGNNTERVNFIETEDKLYFVSHQQTYLSYKGNNWILSVSISKEDAFQPLKNIQRQLIYVILAVLGLSVVLALIAANLFVRPIVQLSKNAEEIGKGNFTVSIDVKSNDEVGRLAKQLGNASTVLLKRLEEQQRLNTILEDQKSEIEKQKVQLEHFNGQISDSIKYAERIQSSILPDISTLSKTVKDAFVLYKPKDVVSGDFYWFEKVRQGRNEYLVIACADCTGHGVPGAIMSIMGSNLLTNIVYYQNYTDPNKILARMDKLIKLEFQKDKAFENNRDGMEIGICVINLDDMQMEFSGAGISLVYISGGELNTIRSPKLMIGGIEGDEREVSAKLSKEVIQLKDGDKLYLASDGFQDQFGGDDDKKFLSKNFRELILSTSASKMPEQASILSNAFESWKKNTPQTDDVLIIGVEI